MNKKRVLVSYDKLSPELLAALNSKYPRGYANHLQRIEAPSPFYYLLLDLQDAVYMIKMNIKEALRLISPEEIELPEDDSVERDENYYYPEESEDE